MPIPTSGRQDPNQAYWRDAEARSNDERELMKQQMNKIHGNFEHRPGKYKRPTFYLWVLLVILIIGSTTIGILLLGKNSEVEGYVLTFETLGGSVIEPQTYFDRDKIDLPENPTKEEYIFSGWYFDEDYENIVKASDLNAYIFMSDVTFYARWIHQNKMITLGFNPVGGSPVDSVIIPYGSSLLSYTSTKEGEYFGGWAQSWTRRSITYTPEENDTLYAMWDPVPMRPIGETKSMYLVPISADDEELLNYVDGGFWMSETETTYALWYEVYLWAIDHGYQFSHQGRDGTVGFEGTTPRQDTSYPVTTISYYDTLLWLNALSEKEGLDPVYRSYNSNIPVSDIDHVNLIYMSDHNGYRLPTQGEWEMAARMTKETQGNDTLMRVRNSYYTKGSLYSGITSSLHEAIDYAWLLINSEEKISSVAAKLPNALGLYDVSGNVCEYVFGLKQQGIMCKGGSFLTNETLDQTRYVHPTSVSIDQGFRFVRG